MTVIDTHPQPCTRPNCRRCTPSPPPAAPPIPKNPHNAAAPRPTVVGADVLADRLERAAALLRSPKGAKAWARVADWQDPASPPSSTKPTPPQPGDDDYDEKQAQDDEARRFVPGAAERREDWLENQLVGGYRDELDRLTSRILGPALTRLEKIVALAVPGQAKHLADADMLKAQVAASGCCASCFRDDKNLVEIELQRREGKPDVPFYKDRCRFCGGWKAKHGQDPPVWVLKKRRIHGPRSITTADETRALAETKSTKGTR